MEIILNILIGGGIIGIGLLVSAVITYIMESKQSRKGFWKEFWCRKLF